MLKIILLVLLVSPCFADEWSAKDIQREKAYMVYDLMDWSQTRYISEHPHIFHETNSILGPHPSPAKVDRYFLAMAAVHVAVVNFLPIELRAMFQTTSIIIEKGFMDHNFSIGISAGF